MRILITTQDAFDYFAKVYDMDVAAPQGVTTDAEVANKDIQKTVDVIVENKVKVIFVESTTDPERIRDLRFSTIHAHMNWDRKRLEKYYRYQIKRGFAAESLDNIVAQPFLGNR